MTAAKSTFVDAAAMLSSTFLGLTGTTPGIMLDQPGSLRGKPSQNEERWRAYFDGIKARNAESLAGLYDETSAILYSLAIRMLNNPADAEEVVLDVYQQVWKIAQPFDSNRGTVLSWLIVLTRSRAIDRWRSSSARRAREMSVDNTLEIAGNGLAPAGMHKLREALAPVLSLGGNA